MEAVKERTTSQDVPGYISTVYTNRDSVYFAWNNQREILANKSAKLQKVWVLLTSHFQENSGSLNYKIKTQKINLAFQDFKVSLSLYSLFTCCASQTQPQTMRRPNHPRLGIAAHLPHLWCLAQKRICLIRQSPHLPVKLLKRENQSPQWRELQQHQQFYRQRMSTIKICNNSQVWTSGQKWSSWPAATWIFI